MGLSFDTTVDWILSPSGLKMYFANNGITCTAPAMVRQSYHQETRANGDMTRLACPLSICCQMESRSLLRFLRLHL